jgi:hypothetical protein
MARLLHLDRPLFPKPKQPSAHSEYNSNCGSAFQEQVYPAAN